MKKLMMFMAAAGITIGSIQANWSMATIGAAQLNDIRANFAAQVYDATTTWDSGHDSVGSDEGYFCDKLNTTIPTSTGLYLYVNGTPQQMYNYLYYLDSNANLSQHPHAYNFRIYVNKLTGTPNHIDNLNPSDTDQNNVSALQQAKSANASQTDAYCSIISPLYNKDLKSAQDAAQQQQDLNNDQNGLQTAQTLQTAAM